MCDLCKGACKGCGMGYGIETDWQHAPLPISTLRTKS